MNRIITINDVVEYLNYESDFGNLWRKELKYIHI